MKIGIDKVDYPTKDTAVDLSTYSDLNEKYVRAVDNTIDIVVTSDIKTAEYFRENGIPAAVLSVD